MLDHIHVKPSFWPLSLTLFVCLFVYLGAPQPEIIWLKDKVEIRPSNKYVMSMDGATGTCGLRILYSQPGDVGVYSCRAENPAGKATCTANVVVVRKYQMDNIPQAQQSKFSVSHTCHYYLQNIINPEKHIIYIFWPYIAVVVYDHHSSIKVV